MNTHDDKARPRLAAMALAAALALALAGCSKGGVQDEHAAEGDKHAAHADKKPAAGEKKDEHAEGAEQLTLTSDEAERAGIRVHTAQAQALGETVVVTATTPFAGKSGATSFADVCVGAKSSVVGNNSTSETSLHKSKALLSSSSICSRVSMLYMGYLAMRNLSLALDHLLPWRA